MLCQGKRKVKEGKEGGGRERSNDFGLRKVRFLGDQI